jgi:hypothetical protein
MEGEITQGDDATKHAIEHAKLLTAKSAGPGLLVTVNDCLVQKHSWYPERNPHYHTTQCNNARGIVNLLFTNRLTVII